MSTQAVHGTNSEVRAAIAADMKDIDFHDSLLLAVYEYCKRGRDRATTPGECFHALEESILGGDPKSLMIVNVRGSTVLGFMHCRVYEEDPKVAIINQGFAVPETHKDRVSDALVLFETWAKKVGCTKGRFFTFRVPGAHKFMERQGWHHALTQYEKEI